MNETILKVALLSILPIGESKIALYIGLTDQTVNPFLIFIIAMMGNSFSFPITYLFLNSLHKRLIKYRWYKKVCIFIGRISKKRTSTLTKKYGFWGLLIFVAIPLPTTGAYMGAIIAWMANYEKKKAFIAVTLGVYIAGILITTVILGSQQYVVLSDLKNLIYK